jgi:hypothetical protein
VSHLQATTRVLCKHSDLLFWVGLSQHSAAQLAAPAVAAANVLRVCSNAKKAIEIYIRNINMLQCNPQMNIHRYATLHPAAQLAASALAAASYLESAAMKANKQNVPYNNGWSCMCVVDTTSNKQAAHQRCMPPTIRCWSWADDPCEELQPQPMQHARNGCHCNQTSAHLPVPQVYCQAQYTSSASNPIPLMLQQQQQQQATPSQIVDSTPADRARTLSTQSTSSAERPSPLTLQQQQERTC